MKNTIQYIMILAGFTLVLASCGGEKGCLDPDAVNYDPEAKRYGTCEYAIPTEPDTGDGNGELTSVQVVFKPMANGQDLYLEKEYKNLDNLTFSLSTAKFYVSNVKLALDGNSKVDLKDVELIDFDTSKPLSPNIPFWDNAFESKVKPNGKANEIYLGLGVDIELNEEFNPNKYPADHPLSTLYTGMGWDWTTKYKFAVFEGKVDSNSNGTLDRSFFYHTGLSDLYRLAIIDMDKSYDLETSKNWELILEVDVPKIFEGLKIETAEESKSHTADSTEKALSAIIQTNLSGAIKFKSLKPL